MGPDEVAKKIDHTLLKPTVMRTDIQRFFTQAFQYPFRAVCVNQRILDQMDTAQIKKLKARGTLIACVIDFPHGQGGYSGKHFGATLARAKGADELDVVWNLGAFLNHQWDEVLRELKPVARVLPTKVIVEAGYIHDAYGFNKFSMHIFREAARLIEESGAFCIKDHTGFGPSVPIERRAEYIRLWKETEPGLLVKTASGIRTLEDARMLLEVGADILGTSAGDKIMEEVARNAKS